MELHRSAAFVKEAAPNVVGHKGLTCARWALQNDETPSLQELIDCVGGGLLEKCCPKGGLELVVLVFHRTQGRPATFICVEIEKRADHLSRFDDVRWHVCADIEFATVA